MEDDKTTCERVINPVEQEYLTAKMLSDRLKVKPSAVYKMVKDDPEFPKVKILKRYRFIESKVKAYLENKEQVKEQ